MAKKIGLQKGPNLYKHSVKRALKNRLRRSVANALRAKYFPQKQENILLARAWRKQKHPASLKFRGQTIKSPKPQIFVSENPA